MVVAWCWWALRMVSRAQLGRAELPSTRRERNCLRLVDANALDASGLRQHVQLGPHRLGLVLRSLDCAPFVAHVQQ